MLSSNELEDKREQPRSQQKSPYDIVLLFHARRRVTTISSFKRKHDSANLWVELFVCSLGTVCILD